MADTPDMGEPAFSDEPPVDPTAASSGPDRRRTIDLLRVERGEPERRKLPRPPIPGDAMRDGAERRGGSTD